MRLDEDLILFLQRPLMCVIAATDEAGRPSAGRGVGVHALEDRRSVEVIFSGWQWPRIAENVSRTGRLAATFVSPSDYVTFQLKGAAVMREAEAADLARAENFMAAATDALSALGVPPPVIAPWLTARDARVARLTVTEIYIQTPGPRAGMSTGTQA